MKPDARLLLLCATLCTPIAQAQDTTAYTLNDGKVHFSAPPDWTAVMEKKDGNPQAVAFQIPDATAQGSDDSATATVKTRELANTNQFSVVVQEEFEHAKAQPGYEIDTSSSDTSVHQYFVVRGKTKYVVRDNFQLKGKIAVEVRCQRPLLAATPAAWNAEFDRTCDRVVASLEP